MGKKVKEYKSGDFIFAKVKGYPAWPARVQKPNGKKYFVYFYGTGETANLPPTMIFDYVDNKDKFLTKSVKRRDFNDGVKQIEYDFANNVPLEQVIGFNPEATAPEAANDTANDTVNETANDTINTTADTTAADDTATADTTAPQNDAAVEDSDEAGNLVIDEGKKKKTAPKTPSAKDQTPKTPKGGRGRPRKEDNKVEEDEDSKKEEIVSRSGRKIRPKRYIDEQTEENATLPSPVPKRKRASPGPEGKDKPLDKTADKTVDKTLEKTAEKTVKQFNAVSQSELEDLKEPFKPADAEKENILIAYLPSGQYVGIKVFDSRPSNFKNEHARLQWDKQAAANAVTLKMQLERGQITPQSISAQLVMDLNLTDEEKATLDKEKETEEKKSRVQFLKTEMKLIELDAKIKTCLCLEKADTELCLKLLDELTELEIKPLMLFKHPTCLETVKRLRAYVGNTPSWDLSESDALAFSKQAHRIRRHADRLYTKLRGLFDTSEGLSFWEYFSERVLQFKKVTAKLNADELLEMVHEPPEMSTPSTTSLKAAIDAANAEEPPLADNKEDEPAQKKKNTPAKAKKAPATPAKTPAKRQSSRNKVQDDKEKKKDETEQSKDDSKKNGEETPKNTEENLETIDETDSAKTPDKVIEEKTADEASTNNEETSKTNNSEENKSSEEPMEVDSEKADSTDKSEIVKETEKDSEQNTKTDDVATKESETEKVSETAENNDKTTKPDKSDEKADKAKDKNDKAKDKSDRSKDKVDKVKEKVDKTKDKTSKSGKSDNNSKEKSVSKDKSDNSKEKVSSKEKPESTKDKPEKTDSTKEKTEQPKDKNESSKDKKDASKDKTTNSKDTSKDKSESKLDSVENDKAESTDTNAKGDSKSEKEDKGDKETEKEKDKEVDEPRAKRSRGENKKTEAPPPRSPAKRKAKF